MANTDGGTIVLGIKEVELENPSQTQKIIWDTVNNRGKVSINLLSDADVEITKLNEHELLVIRILEHFGIEDLDEDTIRQYRQRFSARSPDHPWLSLETAAFLEKLGARRCDRKTGIEGLTAAGLMMFGRAESIREPDALPQYHVDYRERLSSDPAVRWSDRITIDGTWAGNLFLFYTQVIGRISRDLKIPFRLGEDLFRKDDTVVHEALRESLINALIHADYRGQGGIIIERFPDRIEMSNPGTLLISREQMLHGGVSECRNKALQTMFQLIGGGEKAGSGIDKIRMGWTSQHWRSPNHSETARPDRVILRLPMLSLLPEGTIDRLQKRFGQPFSHLTRDEAQALVTAEIESQVTNARLQEITGKHPADLTLVLRRLAERHFLVQRGKARWTTYSLPEVRVESSIQSSGSSIQSSGDVIPRVADAEEDPKDNQILIAIAEPVRKSRWVKQAEMRQIISDLCKGRFLTLEQIATLTNRNRVSLRNVHINQMVKGEILRLRYPERPNHPNQGYQLVNRRDKK